MTDTNRRAVLKLLGAAAVAGGVGSVGTAGAQSRKPKKGKIEKLGHSLLSDPDGEYAEEDVRDDGRYGVVGSFLGEGGSFLVDLSNPTDPEEVHRVPSSADTRNADVAFDPRDGLYYRTQEPNNEDGEGGVEVIDYGFDAGSIAEPEIVADVDVGHTHNVFPHPEEPILYAVNEDFSDDPEPGLDVVDVSNPASPEILGQFGPGGGCHDFVVDPDRDLGHAAYIGGELDAYVVFDTSDPAAPEEIGRFDYAGEPDYTEVGEEGFESCHYADYDPERELAYVGDEVGRGVPGGKHVFDIGYDEGSPEDPVPIGFTHSPNAEEQDDVEDDFPEELFDWTTHNHDVISRGANTLLVSGDYHEGTVVYDVSDPTDPTPTDQYRTDDDEDEVSELFFPGLTAPMAWGANYNEERNLVFTSDMVTGVYTFKVTPGRSKD